MPFRTPPFYRADENGTVVRTENAPLPYYVRLGCANRKKLDAAAGYRLFADGSLYVFDTTGTRVPAANYCLEHYTEAAGQEIRLEAYVCAAAAQRLSAADTKGSWKYFVILAGTVPSIICLASTLIVYAVLSSLRNVHGYYVMCYVACLLMSFVCLLVIQWMPDIIDSTLCKLFGTY